MLETESYGKPKAIPNPRTARNHPGRKYAPFQAAQQCLRDFLSTFTKYTS